MLDLTLGDGTTVTENVRRLVADGSSVIIHSVADRPAAVREALAAGAAGVVSKASPIGDVIAAIRTVARGEPLNNIEWASAVEGDRAFADAQLSTREREVLRLYAAGLPLKVVADRLGVAYSTAKENITRVRVKYVEVGRPGAHEGRPAAACDGGRHPGAIGGERGRCRADADREVLDAAWGLIPQSRESAPGSRQLHPHAHRAHHRAGGRRRVHQRVGAQSLLRGARPVARDPPGWHEALMIASSSRSRA